MLKQLLEKFGSKEKQVLILSLYSCLVLSKLLLSPAGETANVFSYGVTRFLNGGNPYLLGEASDHFKYSPFFALFYMLYAFLPSVPHSFCWALTNLVFFWIGISLWFQLSKKPTWPFFLCFILCTMEMDGPIRHLQMNAFLVGCILIGLYLFKEQKFFTAALILTLFGSFKVYLLFFPAVLLLTRNPKFILGFITGLLLEFFLPAIAVGLPRTLFLHQEWVKAILDNIIHGSKTAAAISEFHFLNIATIAKSTDHEMFGKVLTVVVTIGSAIYLSVTTYQKKIDWNFWIPISLSFILLINPGTETPTFVFLVPSFLFLTEAFENKKAHNLFTVSLLLIAATFLSLIYNDIWPKKWIHFPGTEHGRGKTFAALLIWTLTFYGVFKNKFTKNRY